MPHVHADQIGIGYNIVVEEKDDVAFCLARTRVARCR
jgi:hypothetical protein